jgi:hypothetical protein
MWSSRGGALMRASGLARVCRMVNPLPATLAVVPIQWGKHDTTATKWDKAEETERSRDGVVVLDIVAIPQTDT